MRVCTAALMVLAIAFPASAQRPPGMPPGYRGFVIGEPSVGDNLYAVPLDNAPTLPVYVAVDRSAFDELAVSIAAKDRKGIDVLIEKKKVIGVAHGTRALVLEVHLRSKGVPTLVRFLDGPYADRKGYVSGLCLSDQPPRATEAKTKAKKKR